MMFGRRIARNEEGAAVMGSGSPTIARTPCTSHSPVAPATKVTRVIDGPALPLPGCPAPDIVMSKP